MNAAVEQQESSLSRLEGIDAFRVLAFAAVVFLHAYQPENQSPELGTALTHLGRWAVPFFFLASGFFLGLKNPPTFPSIKNLFTRLAPVLIFWIVVYNFCEGTLHDLTKPKMVLHSMISGSPAFHLWFLFALGISAVCVLLLRHLGLATMLGIASLFYLAGLAFGPYREVLGLPEIPYPFGSGFKTRWGPFLGFLMVGTGYYLGLTGKRPGVAMAISVTLMGVIIQLAEGYALWSFGRNFAPYDYLLGTFFFGTGLFLLSLNLKNSPMLSRLAFFGPVTLGAYCVHLLFIKMLAPNFAVAELGQGSLLAIIAFILSLLSAYAMSFVPFLRRVVK